ncbi:hypothetical protein NQ318_022332 [Aromia moschata]|uniref:Transposase n=1 Tax=Aromia moschata TaxID=1265417 RepID=A0AAV8Z4X4_9CUCU|nr:hypothetical protein NQ318_022332 [Aromia moschata]
MNRNRSHDLTEKLIAAIVVDVASSLQKQSNETVHAKPALKAFGHCSLQIWSTLYRMNLVKRRFALSLIRPWASNMSLILRRSALTGVTGKPFPRHCLVLYFRVSANSGGKTGLDAEDVAINVVGMVVVNPSISSRQIEAESGISRRRALSVLKKHKFRPYTIRKQQQLLPTDPERRLDFCNWYLQQIEQDQLFFKNIIWTDESYVSSAGIFNRHNKHYWSEDNPHQTVDVQHQGRFGFSVWCALYNNRILAYQLYDDNLNGQRHTLEEGDEAKRLDFCLEMGNGVLNDVGFHKRILFSDEPTFSTNGVVSSQHCRYWKNLNRNIYLEMIQIFLTGKLDELPLSYRTRTFFQQDGCPAHHAVTVRNWLNSEFNEQWIGRDVPSA